MEMNMPWDRSSLARRCLVAATCSVFASAVSRSPLRRQRENSAPPTSRRKLPDRPGAAVHGPARHPSAPVAANRIRVFHSRQLGEENQTIEQTRVGAIDMNRINVGAMAT